MRRLLFLIFCSCVFALNTVAATQAHVIATANPGCMMQLEAGLWQRNIEARVVHVIELLDEAMARAPQTPRTN